MTAAKIRFNFDSARARANELDEIADMLRRKCLKGMQDAQEELAAAWKGENANRFLQKSERLELEIQKSAAKLHSVSEAIRQNARIIYDAEMQARRIAEENEN